jgi:hypothetical protein
MPDAPSGRVGFAATLKKRWRAWLRAVHRDIGYLAIGFTVIYAVSGIAQNHVEDWGDVSYKTYERELEMAPIPPGTPPADAIARVAAAAGLGKPASTLVAGDEVRLEYASGTKVTAIGDSGHVTIQARERRAFIGAANWLHKARGKKAWKYVADFYALFLLYLATSGIFMLKGKLGLRGRGAILISIGVAVPIVVVLLGAPAPRQSPPDDTREVADQSPPAPTPPPTGSAAAAGSGIVVPDGVLKPLPPDDDQ